MIKLSFRMIQAAVFGVGLCQASVAGAAPIDKAIYGALTATEVDCTGTGRGSTPCKLKMAGPMACVRAWNSNEAQDYECIVKEESFVQWRDADGNRQYKRKAPCLMDVYEKIPDNFTVYDGYTRKVATSDGSASCSIDPTLLGGPDGIEMSVSMGGRTLNYYSPYECTPDERVKNRARLAGQSDPLWMSSLKKLGIESDPAQRVAYDGIINAIKNYP